MKSLWPGRMVPDDEVGITFGDYTDLATDMAEVLESFYRAFLTGRLEMPNETSRRGRALIDALDEDNAAWREDCTGDAVDNALMAVDSAVRQARNNDGRERAAGKEAA